MRKNAQSINQMTDNNTNKKENLNLTKSPVSEELSDNLFFSEQGIKTLLRKLNAKDYTDNISRNNLILDVIRIKQPISKYALAKITGLSYPTIKQVCKWLQASDLIKIRIEMGSNDMPVQLIYISEEEKEK